MGSKRQSYSPECKDEAVKLVVNTGRTVAAVARELDVKEQTLGRWVQAPIESEVLDGGESPH